MFWNDPNLYGASLPYKDINPQIQSQFAGQGFIPWQNIPRFVPPYYGFTPQVPQLQHPAMTLPYLQSMPYTPFMPPMNVAQHLMPPMNVGQQFVPPMNVGQQFVPPMNVGQNFVPPFNVGQNFVPPFNMGQHFMPPFMQQFGVNPQLHTGFRPFAF